MPLKTNMERSYVAKISKTIGLTELAFYMEVNVERVYTTACMVSGNYP